MRALHDHHAVQDGERPPAEWEARQRQKEAWLPEVEWRS